MTAPAATGAPRLITPGRPGYREADPWNLSVPSRPAAVIQARTAGDVVAAVRHAADHDLRVAVRSSGHGATPLGGSTLLVHTGAMTEFAVDPVRRVARIGPGLPWQPLLEAAARHGLAAVCGSAPGVGAVGYLTGGGLGPLARRFGVSSDFVRAMEVAVGDGELLRATPTENPELFWGLRGGKATLGIVTSLDLDLVALESFYGGALWFAADDAPAVLRGWLRLCEELPEDGTSSVAVLRLPPLAALPGAIGERQVVAVRFGWVGDPGAGENLLRPVRGAAPPLLDDVRLRLYRQIGAVHGDPVAPMPITSQSALLGELNTDALDALVEATRPDINRQTVVELRHLGGAVGRPAEHPSAFCHRDARYSLFVSGPATADVATVDAQAGQVRSALSDWTQPGLLANFAASNDQAEIGRCYDEETRRRLEELGDLFDPGHVLSVGQVVRQTQPRGVKLAARDHAVLPRRLVCGSPYS